MGVGVGGKWFGVGMRVGGEGGGVLGILDYMYSGGGRGGIVV